MINVNAPTVRLPRFSKQQRAILAEISKLRTTDGTRPSTITELNRIREVRTLASEGVLATTVAAASPAWRNALSGAVFALAWPVVYSRLTRRVELNRGHAGCAAAVSRMMPECADRFYDDVEAVVIDVLEHASTPIRNIEAWMASRVVAATVDAHRRRRGELGALQRPRLPRWLSDGLRDDPWLTDLAVNILQWVGVRTTAGAGVWPLDAWGIQRAAIRGERLTTSTAQISRDVETVLAVMRRRPSWYQDYVERPLGHKQAPVASTDVMDDFAPLDLGGRAAAEENHLSTLAAEALQTIRIRLRDAEDPRTAVPEVLRTVFGTAIDSCDIDRVPLAAPDYEERIVAALDNPATAERVVAIVRRELDRQ
jgi:hypothetical protein